MSIRYSSIVLLLTLLASPAWAGPKTATDKVVDSFMELDGNGSESVSWAEYKSMVDKKARKRFRQMDGNRDGEVSADEYRAFWSKEKASWYRLKR